MNAIPPDADTTVHPHPIRGVVNVKRASDDKMVAGVCAGMAKYFNIDPIILRVVLAALTLVGFAGVVLYLAAWLLLPAEDEPQSIAARWFNLGDNEEQWRTVGLAVTAILVVLAVAGFVPWHSGGLSWVTLALLAIAYFGIVRPLRQRSTARAATAGGPAAAGVPAAGVPAAADGPAAAGVPAADDDPTLVLDAPAPRAPKEPWSPALTFITLSASLIALGAVALWAQARGTVPWTSYAVAALAVIALGLLIGARWGNGGLLIPVGILLALTLAVGALLPSARIGHDVVPDDPTNVSSTYKLGIGQLDLNLDTAADTLRGRTITVKVGIGQTRIVLPADLNVEVRSTLRAGEIRVFDRSVDGTQNTLNYPAADPALAKLILDIDQSIGAIEVTRR